jgi:hypothetical protein
LEQQAALKYGCYIQQYAERCGVRRAFMNAWALDPNRSLTLPLYREYNLSDPRGRRSWGFALRSRKAMKARYRNQLLSSWESDDV